MTTTILMPCLNEERTLAACIQEAKKALPDAEILVADNGSTDNSKQIAEENGARVVDVKEKGYGNVLIAGINAARGEYVIMADSDMSYNFGEAPVIEAKLKEGNDLVMGNRFRGGIEPGAMPFLHKYLGNPVLSWLGQWLFDLPIGDFHCGIRGVRKEKFASIPYLATGMEWASEMILRAAKSGYDIAEVPATLRKDGRDRRPHLRTWRDGWRHLKILLLFSPRWLFSIPGATLTLLGLLLTVCLLPGPLVINHVRLDVQTLTCAAFMIIIGVQTIFMGRFAEEIGTIHSMHRRRRTNPPMEWGLAAGLILIIVGTAFTALSISQWASKDFGDLDPQKTLRTIIPAALAVTTGIQFIFSSFILGLTALLEDKK